MVQMGPYSLQDWFKLSVNPGKYKPKQEKPVARLAISSWNLPIHQAQKYENIEKFGNFQVSLCVH